MVERKGDIPDLPFPDERQPGGPIHLMIPNASPVDGLRGRAAYTCDQDGSRGIRAPMTQRTLDPTKATCPDCRSASEGKDALAPATVLDWLLAGDRDGSLKAIVDANKADLAAGITWAVFHRDEHSAELVGTAPARYLADALMRDSADAHDRDQSEYAIVVHREDWTGPDRDGIRVWKGGADEEIVTLWAGSYIAVSTIRELCATFDRQTDDDPPDRIVSAYVRVGDQLKSALVYTHTMDDHDFIVELRRPGTGRLVAAG
jgi:hypothetical protein